MPFVLHRPRIAWAAVFVTGVRLAYLGGVALTLLWAPVRHGPGGNLFLRTFHRWDSVWFERIATHGYQTLQSTAFFPVYPLVVRAVAWVVRDVTLAALLVSLACAAGAGVLLERVARRHLSTDAARTSVVLFAVYPLAFIFTASYSGSLFVFLVLFALDAAERGSAVLAGVAAAVAVDTRLLGLALVPPLILLLRRRSWTLLLVPVALGVWMLFLHQRFGDWLAFSHAERRYWHRQPLSPHAIVDAARTIDAQTANLLFHNPGAPYPHYIAEAAQGLVSLVALAVAVWLTWVAWRRFGAAYGVLSVSTLLLVLGAPSLEQPLESLPRFLLADIPLFLAAAALLERRPRAREAVVVGLASLGAIAAVAFSRGVPWIA